jgi:hypothetical protein
VVANYQGRRHQSRVRRANEVIEIASFFTAAQQTLTIFESTLEILMDHEQTLRERDTRKKSSTINSLPAGRSFGSTGDAMNSGDHAGARRDQ